MIDTVEILRLHKEPSRRIASVERPRGLGDYTEQLLMSIGITKDRYVAAKELFGLAPECACEERKEWLNRVSDWWRGNRDK